MTADMAHDPSTDVATPAQREQRERWVAWVTNVVGCLYCGRMGFHLWRSTGSFGAMFAGLGSVLPTATRQAELASRGSGRRRRTRG